MTTDFYKVILCEHPDSFAALPDSEEHALEAVVNSNWPIRGIRYAARSGRLFQAAIRAASAFRTLPSISNVPPLDHHRRGVASPIPSDAAPRATSALVACLSALGGAFIRAGRGYRHVQSPPGARRAMRQAARRSTNEEVRAVATRPHAGPSCHR